MRFLIIRKPVSVYENIFTVSRICLRASGWYSSGKHYISPRRETHRMKPNENSTVIGKSVTIRGEVSGKEEMFLDCVLQGTVTLPENKLTIGPNARVQADLNAGDVVIYGHVEGNIRATGRIELRDSAVLKGDIVAERLSIEENASMKGKVELSDSAKTMSSGVVASATSAV